MKEFHGGDLEIEYCSEKTRINVDPDVVEGVRTIQNEDLLVICPLTGKTITVAITYHRQKPKILGTTCPECDFNPNRPYQI